VCVYLYIYILSVAFLHIGGRGRAGAGRRGKTVLLWYGTFIYIYLYHGGMGQVGAGSRGKTVLLWYDTFLYILYISEEGAGREQVGGRRQCNYHNFYIKEEGTGREPVGGGRRKISYSIVIFVYAHMDNVWCVPNKYYVWRSVRWYCDIELPEHK